MYITDYSQTNTQIINIVHNTKMEAIGYVDLASIQHNFCQIDWEEFFTYGGVQKFVSIRKKVKDENIFGMDTSSVHCLHIKGIKQTSLRKWLIMGKTK